MFRYGNKSRCLTGCSIFCTQHLFRRAIITSTSIFSFTISILRRNNYLICVLTTKISIIFTTPVITLFWVFNNLVISIVINTWSIYSSRICGYRSIFRISNICHRRRITLSRTLYLQSLCCFPIRKLLVRNFCICKRNLTIIRKNCCIILL